MENSSLKTEVHEFTTLLTLVRLGFLKVVFYGGVKFKPTIPPPPPPPLHISRITNLVPI